MPRNQGTEVLGCRVREPKYRDIETRNAGFQDVRLQKQQDDALTALVVAGARVGDKQAFDLLYRQWQPRLSRFAFRLVRNSEATADIMQDSWVGIARGLARLNNPSRFKGWAYRIVSNKCRDWMRREQARRRSENHVEVEMESLASIDATASENAAIAVSSLGQAIKTLPTEQRTILSLFYLEEWSVREIGAVLSIPDGTVKSRLYHARKTLKNVLEKENMEVKNHE